MKLAGRTVLPDKVKKPVRYGYVSDRLTRRGTQPTGFNARNVAPATVRPASLLGAVTYISSNIASAASKLIPLQLLQFSQQQRDPLSDHLSSNQNLIGIPESQETTAPCMQQEQQKATEQLLPVSEATGTSSHYADGHQPIQHFQLCLRSSDASLGHTESTPAAAAAGVTAAHMGPAAGHHSSSWRVISSTSNSDSADSCNVTGVGVENKLADPVCFNSNDGCSADGSSSSSSGGQIAATASASIAQSINVSSSQPALGAELHSLKFSKHLSTASSSATPFSARLESLSWLLLHSKHLQRQLMPTDSHRDSSSSRLAALPAVGSQAVQQVGSGGAGMDTIRYRSSDSAHQLLQHIYLLGQIILDVGSSNCVSGVRHNKLSSVIASLDYNAVLNRYLEQHDELLNELFWSQLEDSELQATALHVSTSLQTRHTVHTLLVERLLTGLGKEEPAVSAVGNRSDSSGMVYPLLQSSPLAAAITNNNIIINKPEVSSSNSNNCNVMQAAEVSSNSSSSADNVGLSGNSSNLIMRLQNVLIGVAGALMIVWSLVVKTCKLLFAVVILVRNVTVQLLLLKSLAAAGKAVAAVAGSQLQQLAAVPVVGSTSGIGGSSSSSSRSSDVLQSLPGNSSVKKDKWWSLKLPAVDGIGHVAAVAQAPQCSWIQVPAKLPVAAASQVFETDPKISRPSSPAAAAAVAAASASLGLMSAEPLKKSRHAAAAAVNPHNTKASGALSRQTLPVEGARGSGRPRVGAPQQQQLRQVRPRGRLSNSQLLYQLWTPEAAARS